jgi:hypothetical protein
VELLLFAPHNKVKASQELDFDKMTHMLNESIDFATLKKQELRLRDDLWNKLYGEVMGVLMPPSYAGDNWGGERGGEGMEVKAKKSQFSEADVQEMFASIEKVVSWMLFFLSFFSFLIFLPFLMS